MTVIRPEFSTTPKNPFFQLLIRPSLWTWFRPLPFHIICVVPLYIFRKDLGSPWSFTTSIFYEKLDLELLTHRAPQTRTLKIYCSCRTVFPISTLCLFVCFLSQTSVLLKPHSPQTGKTDHGRKLKSKLGDTPGVSQWTSSQNGVHDPGSDENLLYIHRI